MKKKQGFTLIELVVVVAILGIVSGAIAVTFNFTTRSFVKSGMRAEAQFESRYALTEISKYLGVAGSVWVYNQTNKPASVPSVASHHYCYISNHTIYLGISGEPVKTYLGSFPAGTSASIFFSPVTSGSEINMIHIVLNVDDFSISTDVYIQNSSTITNNLITDSRSGLDGVYIEFK